jgi:hypothetical protein
MGRDPRTEGEGTDDEQPLDVSSATRAANTASLLGRAPPAQPTTKIGAFDLEQALAKSREQMEVVPTPAIPFPAEAPPAEPQPAPAVDAAPELAPTTPEPKPKRNTAPVQMVVLALLTIATLAFAIYAARSM